MADNAEALMRAGVISDKQAAKHKFGKPKAKKAPPKVAAAPAAKDGDGDAAPAPSDGKKPFGKGAAC